MAGIDGIVSGLDTSAIIDGRISGISAAGFLQGTVLIPRFVLD